MTEWTEDEARGRFTGTLSNVVEVMGRAAHVRFSDSHTGDMAEYSYDAPLHKVCVMLRGGTRATEAWADGQLCYQGNDFPGAITIIPAGSTRRSFLREGRFRVLAIALSPEGLKRAAIQSDVATSDPTPDPQSNVENARIFALASVMDDVLRRPGPTPLLMDSFAAHLGNLLLPQSSAKARTGNVYGLPPRALCRVVDFIAANLAHDLSLEMLAAETGLGDFAFLRAFKASTGETPHQFVLKARIERAKLLLATSDATLAMIALDLGFSSHSHFTATFRRVVGATPHAYRLAKSNRRPALTLQRVGGEASGI